MKWTVVWLPSARDRLAELWNNGPDRVAITAAANWIDRALERAPLHQGEARADDVRILIEPPLAVYYSVSEQDCMVSVSAVWRWDVSP